MCADLADGNFDDDDVNPLPDYVELGFLGKRGFPPRVTPLQSHVGGRPSWLVNDELPASEELSCGVCKHPLPLLVQLYAPDERFDRSYHRNVYVFCCRNGKCHTQPTEAIRVLRCQLPRESKYMVDVKAVPLAVERATPVCVVCGLPGPSRCGRCRRVHYCSRDHQILHWNLVHKPFCHEVTPSPDALAEESRQTDKVAASSLYAPAEITLEEEWIDDEKYVADAIAAHDVLMGRGKEEDLENDDDDESDSEDEGEGAVEEIVTPGAAASSSAKADDDDDAQSYQRRTVDGEFLRFQRRISFHPKQILRYARLEGESPPPLWVAPTDIPTSEDIPPCPCCGGPREFEFQLLPQLLIHMDVDDTQLDSLDFGTIAVYSCIDSCETKQPYVREFAWRQHFSSHGMALDLEKMRKK